jgi:hypothetical protein
MPQISGGSTIASSAQIVDGIIVDADINASAAIAKSKLAALAIVDADVAAHTTTKITVPATLLTVASQAQGDIIYFNGTNWVRLAPGTSGQFLKTLGAAANPLWAAAGSSSYVQVSTYSSGGGTTSLTTIIFANKLLDNLSEYDLSTGIFTATNAGIYYCSAWLNRSGSNADITGGRLAIVQNGTIKAQTGESSSGSTNDGYESVGTMLNLSANDTVTLQRLQILGTTPVDRNASISTFQIYRIA